MLKLRRDGLKATSGQRVYGTVLPNSRRAGGTRGSLSEGSEGAKEKGGGGSEGTQESSSSPMARDQRAEEMVSEAALSRTAEEL